MKILVEYSKEQNAFHKCTRVERLKTEYAMRQKGKISTYAIIGEFDTHDEADEFINENYELIKNYRMFKDKEGNMHAI